MLIVVAPHAGAWIETEHQKRERLNQFVAPHAGAWIETSTYSEAASHPLVAPHAGAWIETFSNIQLTFKNN